MKALVIGGTFVGGGIFIFAILAMIAGALAVETAQTAVQAMPNPALYELEGVEVVEGTHGVDGHKGEYVLTVQACTGQGRKEWYRETDGRTLHTLCEGPGGIYDLVTVMDKGAKTLFEKTGFRRSATWPEARAAMTRKLATAIRIQTIRKILGVK